MSSIGFRDSSVVIIETSRTVIRGGLGLHELLRTPSIEIQARVGLRPQQRLRQQANGCGGRFIGPSASASTTPNAQSDRLPRWAPMDDALAAEQDIIVSWPFAEGQITDFMQAEALWKYVLFTGLQLRRVQNESPVLLSLISGLPRAAYERTGQIFFERFNLYAASALSGLVLDISDTHTDLTPIYDGLALPGARTTAPVGSRHCERFLAHLLRNNTSVSGVLAELALPPEEHPAALRALARQVWRAGLVRVPVDGMAVREAEDEGVTDIAAVLVAGKEKAASAAEQARAKEIEALDLITVTLGKERHRFWHTPEEHASPESDGIAMTLQDAVNHAIRLTDVDQRQYIWHGLMVTGDIATYVKGIAPALQTYLASFIPSSADQYNEVQPRQIRTVGVPEYFAEYREKGDGLAAFLGSSIVAKVTFHDGKNFISKTDYAEKGPQAVLEMSASLF
ncbi:actin family [Russula vinacea]|nr:actin family [Russula vinacea]